ncbi:MAG: PIN domain-containing protein [Polyangiaceae bacterium]|nr:PIN domain-containing protein [Polyangiaceae bacterium]
MILADTGFWLALANRKDQHHKAAKAALSSAREPLITTWPVLTETCHLLVARLSVDAASLFMSNAARGAFNVFELGAVHLDRIVELMKKYRSLPMDLADASLVICAESLNSGRIFSTDTRDFGAYRWKNRKPFENLLKI